MGETVWCWQEQTDQQNKTNSKMKLSYKLEFNEIEEDGLFNKWLLEQLAVHFRKNIKWDSYTGQNCFDCRLQTQLKLA